MILEVFFLVQYNHFKLTLLPHYPQTDSDMNLPNRYFFMFFPPVQCKVYEHLVVFVVVN